MAILHVTGGPTPAAGEELTAGTRLTARFIEPYLDGAHVHPAFHDAEWDALTGGWKPVGAPDGTPWVLPGAAAADNVAPWVVFIERHEYASGRVQYLRRAPTRVRETSPGEYAIGSIGGG